MFLNSQNKYKKTLKKKQEKSQIPVTQLRVLWALMKYGGIEIYK